LFEEALSHAKTAIALAPNDVPAKGRRVELLASLQRWDEIGADTVDEFAAASPGLTEFHARSLPPDQILEICNRQLASDPGCSDAKYCKLIALARLGRAAEATELIALDRLVESWELGPPPGYVSGQAFHEALTIEIRANPTLRPDPGGKATRDGLQTSILRRPGAVAIEALLGQIREAVDVYEQRLTTSGSQFALGRPQTARIEAWAVVYRAAGRQTSHRHPSGWLSGTYYVAAPSIGGEEAYGGPLILGALGPAERGVNPPWATRAIEPVPGRLVLFPSFVPHATEPCGVEGTRICVAFDIVPVQRERTADRAPAIKGN
jgi:hypothetical protein